MLLELMIVGGIAYGATSIRHKFLSNIKEEKPKTKQKKIVKSKTEHRQLKQVVSSQQDVDRKLVISGVSLALAGAGSLFYTPLGLLSIPGLLYVSVDIFKGAYRALIWDKKLNVDMPIILIIIICIIQGYFFICSLNTFLVMYSRKLLLKVKDDSQHDIIDVFRQQPQTAWILYNETEVEVLMGELKQGDVMIVNAGETVSADGCIISGKALVDQHILTGESQPVEKEVNDQVFALTLVLSGKIMVRVEKTGEETTVSQIGQILNQTTNVKTNMQLKVEEFGDKAVIPILLLSSVCFPVLGAGSAMAILNSHPKYKTTIASYIGILNFLSIAAKQGILIKDGRVFELLNNVDTVVFDKTGTLTEEQPHIVKIHTWKKYDENAVLAYAAVAEHKQTHPIARAILHESTVRELILPEFDEAEYKIGYGLVVKTNQGLIRVGSVRFIEGEQLEIPNETRETQSFCQEHGHSLVLVALDEQVIGGIELHATIRPEAKSIIAGLHKRNIRSIYIISGDHEVPTKNLAEALNINHYVANVLPQDKAKIIENYQKEGKAVCFIGDGINDSIALKKADVSISLKGASTVATDTAQVILMDESLRHLCHLFDIARDYEKNTKITFVTVLTPHFFGLGGALFFDFDLIQSVVLNHLGLALGTGNSLLPRIWYQQKHLDTDVSIDINETNTIPQIGVAEEKLQQPESPSFQGSIAAI